MRPLFAEVSVDSQIRLDIIHFKNKQLINLNISKIQLKLTTNEIN